MINPDKVMYLAEQILIHAGSKEGYNEKALVDFAIIAAYEFESTKKERLEKILKDRGED